MTLHSRNKGKRGELELAAVLSAYGFDSRRGQQFSGSADSPDVTGLPGIHIEAKRTEKFSLYDALAQAIGDAGTKLPVVMHRRNREEWVAVLRLADFIKIFKQAGGQINVG